MLALLLGLLFADLPLDLDVLARDLQTAAHFTQVEAAFAQLHPQP